MGCARESALEGLSDHLLALRAVLEGQGPVGASLPMRASALICEESADRDTTRARLEQALSLEGTLMSGVRHEQGLEIATWLEDGARLILRKAALGELGTDLGAAAEETLIAAGLDAGDGTIVDAAAEWDTPEAAWEEPEPERSADGAQRPSWEAPAREPSRTAWEVPDTTWEASSKEWEIPDTGEVEMTVARAHDSDEAYEREPDTRILEPVPGEDEIRITATNWLDEVSVSDGTLEWPALEGDIEHRQRIDTPRVRHLFPVPEDADWEVRELKYDHYDSRRAS
jgi:hypothetical protein